MAIFLHEDVVKLLQNKFVVVIGDSIQRGIYKDLVSLIQCNKYLSQNCLKRKGELSFMDDVLIEGGSKEKMNNGINYREVRQYKTDYYLVRFYFVTRANNKYMDTILADLKKEPNPDVIMMNSCLWDISRYGNNGMHTYKTNLEKTFAKMCKTLQPECLLIWNTALPVANKICGGFLLPGLEFLSETLRLDIMEGNFYAKELAIIYELDVLDLHYYFRHQLHRRVGDGVHWNYHAHRHMSNLILSHISEAWGVSVPRCIDSWSEPSSYLDCSMRALHDGHQQNFHNDISLSAPPLQNRQTARRSDGGDWNGVPQLINFDEVDPPQTRTVMHQPQQIHNQPPDDTHKERASGMAKSLAETYKHGGRVRLNNLQTHRYNPYGGGHAGMQRGMGRAQTNQNCNRPVVPVWKRQMEARRRQRAVWKHEEELSWQQFRYQ